MKNVVMGGWRRKLIRDWAPWVTLALALAIVLCSNEDVLRSVRADVGVAQVGIGTAILGIVLAGLAILVAFLDEKYIELLEKIPPGLIADLWVFKYAAIVAIVCAAMGMLLVLFADLPLWALRMLFIIALWSFGYLLWLLYDVIKFIAEHAKARAVQIRKKQE